MTELLMMLYHVAQLAVTWLVIGCLVAPIVWGWYCVDESRKEKEAWRE